jgi:hypothetical protein
LKDYLRVIQWVLENEDTAISGLAPPGVDECDEGEVEFEKFYDSEMG